MSITTIVDFETFYDKDAGVSVVSQGLENYARTADAYIVSVVADDFEYAGTIEQAKQDLGDGFFQDKNRKFWAANSNFDQRFSAKHFGESPEPWQCVLDLAKFNQRPHYLAGLIKSMFGKKLDKKVRDDMNGRTWESLPDSEQERVLNYCLEDGRETKKALEMLPKMSATEERIAAHTRMINRRGVAMDVPRMKKDLELMAEVQHKAFLQLPWRNTDVPLSTNAFKKYCREQNLPVPASMAKGDEDCEELMNVHPQLKELVGAMRTFRRCNVQMAKANTALGLTVMDDVPYMPLEILYCGAPHTRRWASKGFNVQNLVKEPWVIEGEYNRKAHNQQECKYVWARHWLIARPGKVFLPFDLAQIEPRCLNWLVGNEEMLSAVRKGYGIYEAYALAFKNWGGNAGTLKKTDANLYARCKAEVLGLGYGMGATKYQGEALKSGVVLTPDEAKAAVLAFRKDNPKIPAFWKQFDAQIRGACNAPDKLLEIEMPTGDYLRHFDIRATPASTDEDGKKKMGGYRSVVVKGDYTYDTIKNIWGGVLTENVTQRMARDILAEAVLNLEAAGLPVIFHAHDEVILEVDDNEASRRDALAEATHIMQTPPAWCPDLPLGVEGEFSPCYTK